MIMLGDLNLKVGSDNKPLKCDMGKRSIEVHNDGILDVQNKKRADISLERDRNFLVRIVICDFRSRLLSPLKLNLDL